MTDLVIKAEALSKQYRIGSREPYSTLRDRLTGLLRGRGWARARGADDSRIWALRDVSFEVRRGEVVGVIGRNGAGKSTLLKILSRITRPTEGRVGLRGRVGSLLEVGTGFHPELTGRENILLNGSILGMGRAEIGRKFDEIVAFAEVERFIDTPVKHYSSGMYMRLAFSVAAHLEPEILLVDEVLAVGDAAFQKKCLGKMSEVAGEGRTVLFVSHNMPLITTLCHRCVLLEGGRIISEGRTSDVVLRYYSDGANSPASFDYSARERPVGDDYALLLSGAIRNCKGDIAGEIDIREPFSLQMRYRILRPMPVKPVPVFHCFTADGTHVFMSMAEEVSPLEEGEYTAACYVPGNFLNDGVYFAGVAVTSFYESAHHINFYERNALSFNVRDPVEGIVYRHGYNGPIAGAVRPLLRWEIAKV